MGRVQLTNTPNLGVLWNNYNSKDPITILKGNVQDITVYNGNPIGNMAFSVVFTGASFMQVSVLVSAFALASLL